MKINKKLIGWAIIDDSNQIAISDIFFEDECPATEWRESAAIYGTKKLANQILAKSSNPDYYKIVRIDLSF